MTDSILTDTQQGDNGQFSLDQLLENLHINSVTRSISNNLFGFNARGTRSYLPFNKDSQGYVFFTRPQLNLSSVNISNVRNFFTLFNDNKKSYQRYVRCTLDPRLALEDISPELDFGGETVTSPFVDNQNAFIPILSNTVMSLSGWPDLVLPTYTSDSGIYLEEHSMVDGVSNHYEAFDVDVTFRNFKGSPLIYLFYIWAKYESHVFEGILNPYNDFIIENEIDYNTRIYRLVLDDQKRYVRYMACTGAAFPYTVPTGNIFDYDTETPFNLRLNEVNIRFRCIGFRAFDDIVKKDFNAAQAIFNPAIREILTFDLENDVTDATTREDDSVDYRMAGYVKVPHRLKLLAESSVTNPYNSLNFRMYPYVNLYTNELEWWVDERYFNRELTESFEESL